MVSFIALLLLLAYPGLHSSLENNRTGKFLLKTVRFANSFCETGSPTTEPQLGVCYLESECQKLGGSASKDCANGLGTCCFFVRRTSDVSESRLTYWRNPSYPNEELGMEVVNTLIPPYAGICQIRFDFESFELPSPKSEYVSSAEQTNLCKDGFKITGFLGSLSPKTLENFVLCGNNNGQHMYVHFPPSKEDRSFNMTFMIKSQNAKWNIRTTMIDCITPQGNSFPATCNILAPMAPIGCLQYFASGRGLFQSFNFNGPIISHQEYTSCFNIPADKKRITFTKQRFSLGDIRRAEPDPPGSDPEDTEPIKECDASGEAVLEFPYTIIRERCPTVPGADFDLGLDSIAVPAIGPVAVNVNMAPKGQSINATTGFQFAFE